MVESASNGTMGFAFARTISKDPEGVYCMTFGNLGCTKRAKVLMFLIPASCMVAKKFENGSFLT